MYGTCHEDDSTVPHADDNLLCVQLFTAEHIGFLAMPLQCNVTQTKKKKIDGTCTAMNLQQPALLSVILQLTSALPLGLNECLCSVPAIAPKCCKYLLYWLVLNLGSPDDVASFLEALPCHAVVD